MISVPLWYRLWASVLCIHITSEKRRKGSLGQAKRLFVSEYGRWARANWPHLNPITPLHGY
jgi:hypothetical protein